MDDGDEGDFTTILETSQDTSYVVTEGITRGKTYRFRYRVKNV